MASVTTPRNPRFFFVPWFWAGLGLAVEIAALSWLYLAGDNVARNVAVWAGLVIAGASVAMRFQSSATPTTPAAFRLLLAGVFALLAVAVTGVMLGSWVDRGPLRPGLATVLWMLTTPLSALAAWQTWQRRGAGMALQRLEVAALLLLAFALTCLVAQIALVDEDWYSLKNFLAVLTWAAVFGAPLAAAETRTRRAATSAFLAFHFFGIITATLSLSPNPWIFSQLAVRIYRPYLEFLYLSNAYHFYSPEPGPASHLWFRLYFEDEQGDAKATWFKVPHLDEAGQPRHTTALIYQRYLSLTENTVNTETVAIENPEFEKRLMRRRLWSPNTPNKDPIVGQETVPMEERIPFHPDLTPSQQFKPPTPDTRRLLASYARYVARHAMQEYPDLKFVKLRFYRVVHIIPPAYLYMQGWDPNDPNFFHPYYMGEYAADGRLLAPNDPFLYWMLPVLRDPPVQYRSKIRDWARKHAGDPEWVCISHDNGRRQWIEEKARFVE